MYVTGRGEYRRSHVNGQIRKSLSPAANLTRGDQSTLSIEVFPIGSRVQVTNYSPWRGLRGTVLTIHMIAQTRDEPFCFYLVALDGVQLKEPIWFEYTEVELLTPPSVDTLIVERARLEEGNQKGST
jgi:hypothetical protein